MSERELRVLAVAAPQWSHRPEGVSVKSFTAASPFSLQNAVRMAAGYASAGDPVWGQSNWAEADGKFGLNQTVQLYEFYEESRRKFETALTELEPNLLFIGAMSISMKGAIELACMAKERLGERCLVVLGGKHCNETLYSDLKGNLVHRTTSPLSLMSLGQIRAVNGAPVFDLVCSGEGEELCTEIGRALSGCLKKGIPAQAVARNLDSLRAAKGKWIVGSFSTGSIVLLESAGIDLDFAHIPVVPELFRVESKFPVFGGLPTGHAISDMGRGCRYDCYFCSERSGLNGKLRKTTLSFSPAARLVRHFQAISAQDKGGSTACFVEDSILLGGNKALIQDLIISLEKSPLPGFQFGCQLTVNDVKTLAVSVDGKPSALAQLRKLGLSYVAIGLETINEEIASRMSKHRAQQLWAIENDNAVRKLVELDIAVGVYLLWGLGENQSERIAQLRQLIHWQDTLDNQPCAVGLNWATHHPANIESGQDSPAIESTRQAYNYLEWATSPSSKRLPYFVELFGESAEKYAHLPLELPSLKDLEQIKRHYGRLRLD